MPTVRQTFTTFFIIAAFVCFFGGTTLAQKQKRITLTPKLTPIDNQDSEFQLIVNVKISDGWHIYDSVPEGNPSPVTELELELPEGVSQVGQWQRPDSHPDHLDPEVKVITGDAEFVCTLKIEPSDAARTAKVAVRFQICSEKMCQPPKTETLEVNIPATETESTDANPEPPKFENELFDAPIRLMVGNDPLNVAARQKFPSPAMYDVDHDGQLELVVGDISGHINFYENENENDSEAGPKWAAHEPLKSNDGEPIRVHNW